MSAKEVYYITIKPQLSKDTIADMENKFKQASKRIGANLGSALKSSVKGASMSIVSQLSIANILGNSISNLMQLPDKARTTAMELRQLAIQTKNLSNVGDLTATQTGALYQGLQSAGFQGDTNDLREVFAETAKTKATGGRFEGSKLETGEILAQVLNNWQEVGRRYGFNSQQFQDAKKEVETIIGGVDTARKFESLIKSDKSIKDIYKQGKSELGITEEATNNKIYNDNLKKLQELSSQTLETRQQKFLFTKKIDEASIKELANIQDSSFNLALQGLTDSQLLKSQITIANSMKKTQENIEKNIAKLLNVVIDGVDKFKNFDKTLKTVGKVTADKANNFNNPTAIPTANLKGASIKSFWQEVTRASKRDLDGF
jgi:hypothetical protein